LEFSISKFEFWVRGQWRLCLMFLVDFILLGLVLFRLILLRCRLLIFLLRVLVLYSNSGLSRPCIAVSVRRLIPSAILWLIRRWPIGTHPMLVFLWSLAQ
jgi:hypothetical protein